MPEWEPIGSVVKTQIQVTRMVYDGAYHLEHLREVESLWLTEAGVAGCHQGRSEVDYHHRDHPDLVSFQPDRQLSIGFTGHYDAMDQHFGDVPFGCAGENIIVDHRGIMSESDMSKGVRIETASGPIDIVGAVVAKPCVPFTKFLLNGQTDIETSVVVNRRFLDNGMRGFVMSLVDVPAGGATVANGDDVFVRRA